MEHILTGQAGEAAAAEYLQKKGYSILELNYRFEKCEIDIIAKHKNTVVFVEVKTRSKSTHGWPEAAVTEAKQSKIATAAEEYLIANDIHSEIRFDVVSINHRDDKLQFYHIVDAFCP